MLSRYHKLFLLIVCLVVAAVIVSVKIPIRRGLDLAGGIRVVLQADKDQLPKTADQKAAKMNAVMKVLRSRAKGLAGVADPIIQKQGEDRVIVELPGLKNRKEALDTIKDTSKLEFYYLKNVWTSTGDGVKGNRLGKWEMLSSEQDSDTGYEIYSFRNTATNEIIRGDTEKSRAKILKEVVNAYNATDNPDGDKPILTGDDLKPNAQGDLNQANPVIRVEFNNNGTPIFRDFTRRHIGQILAIFLGDRILTAPTINDAIPGGKAEISGFATLDEAQRRADFLNAGALPVTLNIAQLDNVEATLGVEVVRHALIAGIIGLALIALFMLVIYRLPGALADVALAIYALLTLAVFKAIGVTITLPGLAGFILSIGMAVDANILIFERLKEELMDGKTLRAAIDAGFNRAFTAILDSNVCTIITCLILYKFATGMVQSFATTLALGVIISMFTAITVTRTFLHLLVTQSWAQNPKLFGLGESWFVRSKMNIVGRRNVFFGISALMIIPGVIFFILNFGQFGFGLKPGIEFKSGTSLQMTFNRPVTVTEISSIVNKLGIENTVQISDKKTAFVRTSLLPGTPAYESKVSSIKDTLTKSVGPVANVQESSVGPVVSKDLTTNAIWAVVLASIAIVLYLSFRFAVGGFLQGLRYGACTVAATLHDAVIMIGMFAVLGYFLHWEVDTLFVTAVLTVIGFSTHDTIVVFDRIRENMRHRIKGEDYEGLANRSILQTFTRSINTSVTVLFTLVALTGLGGPLIRHFYIALLVGIVVGTYSSIFCATPLLVVFQNFASRKKSGEPKKSFEDKPMMPQDLKPMESSADSDSSDADQADYDRAKVKPKKKKRRY